MLKDVLKNLKQHCMSGISYMIPVIVIGGFCTALARLAGNVDTAGTIGYAFLQAGNAAFALMMSVLCAGIAYSICGKPGIAPGVVAGYLSTQVKASFLGALICGILIGIMILWMQEHFPDSKALKSMYPIVIYPVISGIIATLLIMFVFGPPLAALTQAAIDFFMNMNTGSKFLLGFILGCMTGFDMGGPVNKICFSVVSAFAASGIWGPAAGKNAAAMAPPMGMAISALVLTPKKYTEQEREDAKVAIAMSLCQVTEGALPFAFNDPKRVIPAVTIGSGVAHGLILTWGVTVPVLHGGIFSVPLASNPMLWIAAWLIGAMVTAVIVSVTKPARPVETVHEDEELKDDFDIEIVEKHHNQKIDAPSGTALMLADAMCEEIEKPMKYEYDRHSKREKRTKNEIGIHAVRGGTIVGEHEIIFAGRDEIITLSHSARSKEIFAVGAVNAAVYMNGKGAGLYDMKELID